MSDTKSDTFELVKEVRLKDGTVIPKCTPCQLSFAVGVKVHNPVKDFKTSGNSLSGLFREFDAAPDLSALEEEVMDSVCTSPTGHSVEPDGFGPDGVPSWLMIFGLI